MFYMSHTEVHMVFEQQVLKVLNNRPCRYWNFKVIDVLEHN